MSEPTVEAEMDGTPDLLRTFLARRDVPCPNCNYNLRDLQSSLCPECGEKIILRVSLAEPRQGLLIAGMIGLSAGAGLNGLLFIYMAIQLVRFPQTTNDIKHFFIINAIGLVVEGAALAIWIFKWRRIRRATLSARIKLVVLCWVLTLLNIVFFSFTVR